MKLALAAVAFLGVVVAGCSTSSINSYITTLQGDIAVVGPAVQSVAKQLCQFEPTLDTIAAIITQNNPIVSTVDDVAKKICDAVTPAPSASGVKAEAPVNPHVGNVPVRGHFTYN